MNQCKNRQRWTKQPRLAYSIQLGIAMHSSAAGWSGRLCGTMGDTGRINQICT